MKSVSYIFGGESKVKVMRLFIFNPESVFSYSEISSRVKEKPETVRKDVTSLVKAGLVKRRVRGFILDQSYRYLSAIGSFLIDITPISSKEIIKLVSRAGNIKLILISGLFLHETDVRADILIVGDNIKKAKLLSAVSSIEAKLGKELRYAAFETVDFQYRLSIYDKLIRDILDVRHEKILDKLGI